MPNSNRFSAFVSRGIIQVICLLLLLTYTSVATTSLLLLRSLKFDNVDKVYTYLSPDLEYFHGRHLPYLIVAAICTIMIVIGLPLLLLLEPFLNSKINFTRIKPLLDQFQGCFKNKYRWFAAYYMICRLIILMIVIADTSTVFFLVITTTVQALVHLIIRPYSSKVLNICDGVILQLMIIVLTLVIVDSSDLTLAVVLILLILPLVTFTIMELMVYRECISKIGKCFRSKNATNESTDNPIPASDIGIIVDDNLRRRATVCEM